MLNEVKLALRITGTAFDTEIQLIINAAIAEMKALGVTNISQTVESVTTYDPQCAIAIIEYCKWKFGSNEESEKWEKMYHEQLAQLKTMTGHTNWTIGSTN